ncbi:N-methyl-L-tryptophan oxidase [Planctomicrobium sp. SH664]|uniref:N-methyl-L-tryptophan oxidase n=1 Tax=Planctomicrobium sp. SH664 TaxID=3448125 RepID=UPI003F5B8453
MPHYDAIVLGTGGVGSAALDQFAQRGLRVLGIDRFPPAHDRGSSHGQTRIIRQAYFEHPDYVPLLKRAYTLWEDLEVRSGQTLYQESGLLEIGPPNGIVVPGVLASARLHDLAIDELSPREVQERFPGFVCPFNSAAVFERRAGFLFVEECIKAATAQALSRGAELRIGETVTSWSASPGHVEVTTDHDIYSAAHLVITAGAWAGHFLRELGVRFEVVRKPLYWYETKSSVYEYSRGAPGFFYELPDGYFYGFPQIDARGLKVAEHSGGEAVPDPLTVKRQELSHETRRVEKFLAEFLPAVGRRQTRFEVCLYTRSPDEHFIIDRHPGHPHVSFAAGLSGHGFKFASVLGEALVDLSLGCSPAVSLDFLSASRAAIH